MHMHIIPLIKLSNFRERKIHIAHHQTPNSFYVFILLHTCWEFPERAWESLCFAFKEQSIVKKAANLDKENNKKVKSKEELSDIEMEEAVDYETESESNHNCVFLVIFTLNFWLLILVLHIKISQWENKNVLMNLGLY